MNTKQKKTQTAPWDQMTTQTWEVPHIQQQAAPNAKTFYFIQITFNIKHFEKTSGELQMS